MGTMGMGQQLNRMILVVFPIAGGSFVVNVGIFSRWEPWDISKTREEKRNRKENQVQKCS